MNTVNIGDYAVVSISGQDTKCRIINQYTRQKCYLVEVIGAVEISDGIEMQSMSMLKVNQNFLKKVAE